MSLHPSLILLLVLTLGSARSEAHIYQHHGGPEFVPNLGQWEEDFLYRVEVPNGALFLEEDRFTWNLQNLEDLQQFAAQKENGQMDVPVEVRGHAFQVRFPGADSRNIEPLSAAKPHYRNYFLGDNRSRWIGQVPLYEGVRYENLWPGIDLEIYNHLTELKYDFRVQPGAPVGGIRMEYPNDVNLSIKDGKLLIESGAGVIEELRPVAWQHVGGEEKIKPVGINWKINGQTASFELTDDYDSRLPLIIDPVFEFGTFTGALSDNWGYTATWDADGHLYGGGIVFGPDYPVTMGAYQEVWAGGSGGFQIDVGITKYTPDGSGIVWSTFLGGSGNELPHSLVVNDNNELFVYGTTSSSDFPTSLGAADDSFAGGPAINVTAIDFVGTDIYVSRFSADGSSLLGSTYVGGSGNDGMNIAAELHSNYGDHARGEIVLDPTGAPVIASSTTSPDFPTTPGAWSNLPQGGQDGVIFRLDANLTTLTSSTYFGGSNDDGSYSTKLAQTGEVLVCGGSRSFDLPTSLDAVEPTYLGGLVDGYAARLSADLSTVNACTYLGGSLYDQTYFIERDANDFVYVTGQSRDGFPISSGVYANPGSAHFIAKLSSDLGSFEYSTVFGDGTNTVNISPTAFLVDICENVYVSGWGGTTNAFFNPDAGFTNGLPTTADALQSTTDGSDFYFFVLSKNGISNLYSSYFGGNGSSEHVDGGTSRFDPEGVIYQAVCAGCGGSDLFPTTPGAWSESNGSTNCNLGTAKIRFDLSGVRADSDALPSINGCAPFTVDFNNVSTGAVDYIWDFGDGSAGSTVFEPTHTFVLPGTYSVQLVAIDSNSCNIADTSYVTIVVGIDSISANFDLSDTRNCDTLWADFSDLSQTLPGTTNYFWDFGDGTTSNDTTDVSHIYTTPGTYTVQLILSDSNSCNLRDTFSIVIEYAAGFASNFTVDYEGCIPVLALFENDFEDGDSYTWDFGDGNTGSGLNLTHTYNSAGTFVVTLSTEFCGITETSTANIDVPADPIAFFADEPAAAIINTPVTFINLSSFATSYIWDFGDGSTSADVSPTHSFAGEGEWTVCLTARNGFGCEDVYCRTIRIESDGVVDMPTAFTPNGDGINDLFSIAGFGFQSVQFRIFNRWGELVFETDNPDQGWDGTFRGVLQEMDVYTWTLKVVFANRRTENLQGNLTLIR